MHPLDPSSDMQVRGLLQHIPLLGMAATAVRIRGENNVQLWHLVVAMLGLALLIGSTFGTLIWNQASKQTEVVEKITQIRRDNEVQDVNISYMRRRQEINEERIKQLEVQAALAKEFDDRMVKEHADIYQAIRNSRR